MTDDADAERGHGDRRDDYEQVLETIAHNTGDPQPPLASARPLFNTLVANGPVEAMNAEKAMQAAVENGHVVRWTDGDNIVRYALTGDGIDHVVASNPYGPADADALRECVKTEASREDPERGFIGWANKRLAEL
jgi:hypothetical protein